MWGPRLSPWLPLCVAVLAVPAEAPSQQSSSQASGCLQVALVESPGPRTRVRGQLPALGPTARAEPVAGALLGFLLLHSGPCLVSGLRPILAAPGLQETCLHHR